jgi:plasmid stability protein
MTLPKPPEDLHRLIRLYAAEHGLSAEDAVRRLLEEGGQPTERLGDVLTTNAQARAADFPDTPRDRTPVSPADIG